MSNESPNSVLQDAHTYYCAQKYQIVDEYLFAGPFMQHQRGVDRTKMIHLARHPELNLNPLIMVDSLNERYFQILKYVSTHVTFL